MDGLARRLARERRAFLARPRRAWADHLARMRAFLSERLAAADPNRPALILGAGTGLEVPWDRVPKLAMGWDADPWSRLGTALRHRRWPSWRFDDVTGAMEPLFQAARRSARESWSGRRRPLAIAQARLAALLPGLPVQPVPLQEVLRDRGPGVIVAANLMGQFGEVARREIEAAFAPLDPWEDDPVDLEAAFWGWHRRVLEAFLETLNRSGSALVLVHDRAVLEGPEVPVLGPFTDTWTDQLRGSGTVEAHDPLSGWDVVAHLRPRIPQRAQRWWWPVGPGQIHLVEALAYEES